MKRMLLSLPYLFLCLASAMGVLGVCAAEPVQVLFPYTAARAFTKLDQAKQRVLNHWSFTDWYEPRMFGDNLVSYLAGASAKDHAEKMKTYNGGPGEEWKKAK